jgi:intracellular sulfur oxidation DsrE/DsrF family protein
MKRIPVVLGLTAIVSLAACDRGKLNDLARSDSLRADSIVRIKDEMLNEVMASTQFVNDLNGEIAKLKTPLPTSLKSGTRAENEIEQAKQDREAVTERVRQLVARLDSSEARMASLRSRVASLSKKDDQLSQQVALYEKTITDLKDAAERQRTELQAIIDQQGTKIVALNQKVDTMTKDNARLTTVSTALSDTVGQLTTEKNTAYYVVGTRDELVKKGVLVEEGHRPVLGLFGSRPVAPARSLDPAQFVRIDRLKDRVIQLPDGEFSIVSRQDPQYATPAEKKDDKIAGALKVDRPEKFWEPSRFLVLVRR